MKYDFKKIEKKWQKRWLEEKVFAAHEKSKKLKYYQLETFPYPSAAGLHVGHPKGYIAEDIHARFMRMNGREVLYAMGWDAFGLPTENYAIKVGKAPREVAEENIKNFRRQVRMFGLSYDWDREINTSSPDYYRWTQWLFIQLFKKGLAYRAKAEVNWCPKDQTVLANEQVILKALKDDPEQRRGVTEESQTKIGVCERCETPVEQREMEQWFLKITDYADRLLNDLKGLDWPAATVKRQEAWIGRSEGAEIDFEIVKGVAPSYVLLHGYTGSPIKNFFPRLKKELEKRGAKVYVPELPDTDDPRIADQVAAVLKSVPFDKDTVIVGHSLGGVVAFKILEQLKKPIRRTVLVTSFSENKFITESFEPHTFDWKFDAEKIKKNAGEIFILRDTTDDTVPSFQANNLENLLDGKIFNFAAHEPHATGKKEPEILNHCIDSIKVFTTRPDTLFGATYLVLAPEHWIISSLLSKVSNRSEVECYLEEASHKTELMRQEQAREKTGVELKGVKAVNPATKEEIPIWIADYVLGSYGTGAIMAVPAHDERDFEFAKKFKLLVRKVIVPKALASFSRNAEDIAIGARSALRVESDCWMGDGKLVNSEKFSGMPSEKAKWEITKFVGGEKKIQYRLRDWSVSRQRYWGVPIPMIHCSTCGILPVSEKELPVLLPQLEDYRPQGMPPLASSKKFIEIRCPQCGGEARRDAETLDTFVDSSWYYLRYTDPKNDRAPFNKAKAKHWLPVDLYVIGAEHTVLHLLYSRFITKFLADEGYLTFSEPFLKLRHVGLIQGSDGQKMSKSRGNVVNPDKLLEEFGADAVRLYEMFMGPFEDSQPWDSKGVVGTERFLNRFSAYVSGVAVARGAKTTPQHRAVLQKTIKKVGEDIAAFKFNTAISSLMILLNELEGASLALADLEKIIKLIHPFAPHLGQELWEQLGHNTFLDFEPWPEFDSKLIIEDTFELVMQVNGTLRDKAMVSKDISQAEAEKLALASEKVKRFVSTPPKKVVFVPGKLINIVL